MGRLYQWLSERASSFRTDRPGHGTIRTVRTEVRVERQGLLVGGSGVGLDICPLCGQKLAPVQAEQTRLRLQEGATPQEDLPADGTSS